MRRSGLFLGLAVLSTTLFSCGNGGENKTPEGFLVMPKGAPTLALYDTIIKKGKDVTILENAQGVSDLMLNNDYKYIVFDAYAGQNLIDGGKSKDYVFKKLLTGGNFHLVGFNENKTLPTAEDYIVGFGKPQMVPNKVYKYLYNDVPVDYSFAGVSDLKEYLKAMDATGKVANQKIDWAFIAEPALNGLKKETNFKNNLKIDINIKDAFKEKTGMECLIQAGLFVNKHHLEKNPAEVEEFLEEVDTQLNAALNDPVTVANAMDEFEADPKKQLSLFGFNSGVVKALQSENKNRFGIVSPDVKIGLEEIHQFKTIIG